MSDIPDRLTAALSDRYAIERELGEGGLATVYLAERTVHRRGTERKSWLHGGRNRILLITLASRFRPRAALQGLYRIEREFGEEGMATVGGRSGGTVGASCSGAECCRCCGVTPAWR